MVSRVIPVETFDLVIFGGTGDLARRKILPGLYRRFRAGQMPAERAHHRRRAGRAWTTTPSAQMAGPRICEFGGAGQG